MTKEFGVHSYCEGDDEEIVQLLKLVFDGWPHLDIFCSSIEYWRWKFRDNPLKNEFISVCVVDEKIIGVNHSIPLKIKINEKHLLCTTGADLAVLPNFRRMGVSNRLISHSQEIRRRKGIKVIYWITGNPFFISSLSKKYPLFPQILVNLVRIKDIGQHLRKMPVENAWLRRIGFYSVKLINDIGNAIRGPVSSDIEVSIREVNGFDVRTDKFWEEVSEWYDFIVERRRDYLNWRYCDPRVGEFIIKQAEDNGKIVGYCVLRINRYREHYPIGYIVDLLTLPDRLDVADKLVQSAINYFDKCNINIVNYQVVKGHPYERVLKRHHFHNSRIKIFLFYNSYEEENSVSKLKKSPASKIYISWGDHYILPVVMPRYR